MRKSHADHLRPRLHDGGLAIFLLHSRSHSSGPAHTKWVLSLRRFSKTTFLLLVTLGGCYSADTIVLDYPPTEEQTRAFNELSGEESTITLDDGTVTGGKNSSIDPLVVHSGPFWDRQGVPLARVQNITVVDTHDIWWRGPLTVAAVTTGVAIAAPIEGGTIGEAALVGGLLGLTYLNGVTAIFTAPRRTFVLAPERDDSATARRRADNPGSRPED